MIRLLAGDCRDVLPTLAAESVHTVVTSPPYYGLRDYGTALWDGGDAGCDHRESDKRSSRRLGVFHGGDDEFQTHPYRDTCGKCGAVRVDRQIGLEATPDEYLATMVGVFREVRRVLRRDGTCWVNIGDSFSSGNGTRTNNNGSGASSLMADGRDEASRLHSLSLTKTIGMELPRVEHGLAAKQLLLMPARLALALQADGWWVRSDVIWHKPNPMPESVTDRPTSAHEHVFLLTKSARYYYDADAVREDSADPEGSAQRYGSAFFVGPKHESGGYSANGQTHTAGMKQFNGSRNLRNVWTIATSPFSAGHFATFPPELAERCIKAGTSERGCCAACGKPWHRATEVSYTDAHRGMVGNQRKTITTKPHTTHMHAGREDDVRMDKHVATTGWSPGCQCGTTETRPCVVLDPFAGAGTTLLVADRLQRDAVGIELNTAYTEMAMERCRNDAPLFTSFPPAEPPEDERMADLFTDMAAD